MTLGEVATALEEMGGVTHAYRSKLGEDHPFSLVCANNLAAALQHNGETEEALRLARWAERRSEIQLGRKHPHYLAAAMNKAACLFALGETSDAVMAMRETADLMESALGPRHPDVLLCRANLAVIVAATGGKDPRVDEAIAALQERVSERHPQSEIYVLDV